MIIIKEYKCECGKIFYNSQSFNGHRCHCKEHLGEEKYFKQVERQRESQKIAISAIKEKSKKFHYEKEIWLQNWINEQHKCEHCGKIMTEYYGSGRFCSQSCANSKPHTDKSRLKTAYSLKKYYSEKIKDTQNKSNQKHNDISMDFLEYVEGTKELYLKGIVNNRNLKYYTKDKIFEEDYVICPYCGARFSEIQARHLNKHNKTKKDLYKEFGKDYKTVSNITSQNKSVATKEAQEKLIKEGRHKGWQSRNIESYAESFWKNVLDNNNIEYKREYMIKKKDLGIDSQYSYFLDFLLPNKIDLEIDGKQHNFRKEHDKLRDTILEQNGYIVYRIKWINPKRKEEVNKQINDFLKWYNINKEK